MSGERTDVLVAICASLDHLRTALILAEAQDDQFAIVILERAIETLAAAIDEISAGVELPLK